MLGSDETAAGGQAGNWRSGRSMRPNVRCASVVHAKSSEEMYNVAEPQREPSAASRAQADSLTTAFGLPPSHGQFEPSIVL